MKLLPRQLAEIKARRDAAFDHVCELCKTGKWRMSIPVHNEADSDIIISNALRDSEALQECITTLETERKAYRRRRVADELPEDGVPVVVGRDDYDFPEDMKIAQWYEGGEQWEVLRPQARTRRYSFDWWAPIPKETANVASNY